MKIEDVINKDYTTNLLTRKIKADLIIIATRIEKDAINFNKPEQKNFDKMTMSGVREDYERVNSLSVVWKQKYWL